jgi:hypothetical protein
LLSQGWKLFLKGWIGVYALSNVIGYAIINGIQLSGVKHMALGLTPAFVYTFIGIDALLPVSALILKICVLVGTLKLLCKPEDDEEQLLMSSRPN